MTKTTLMAALALAWLGLPAAAQAQVYLHGGDPIDAFNPEQAEYLRCLAERPGDRDLCEARYEEQKNKLWVERMMNRIKNPRPPSIFDKKPSQ